MPKYIQLPEIRLLKTFSTILPDGENVLAISYLYLPKAYRYELRTFSINALQEMISKMESDRVGPWTYPGLDGFEIRYGSDIRNAAGAKFWKAKLAKAQPWQDKILSTLPRLKYPIDGYQAIDGTSLEPLDHYSPAQLLQIQSATRLRSKAEFTKKNYLDLPKIT